MEFFGMPVHVSPFCTVAEEYTTRVKIPRRGITRRIKATRQVPGFVIIDKTCVVHPDAWDELKKQLFGGTER